ncbi:MAG TPA: glycosyltransferase family 39 protein, partial [Planctomycetota bacterium]|nr:glycosyltransferase family 39 protein [Planctomycetota bacterium]
NDAPFLVVGRLVTALFAAGTVWLVYLIGKRISGRALGLTAAAVLAVMPGHVVLGRLVKEDVPCAFWSTAATLFLVDAITKGRVRDAVRSGLAAGLGCAVKYYTFALAIPAAFAFLFRAPSAPGRLGRGVALGALWGGMFFVGFFAGSPYNFLNPLGRAPLTSAVQRVQSTFGMAPKAMTPPGGWGAAAPPSEQAPSTEPAPPPAPPQSGAQHGRMTEGASAGQVALYGARSLTVGHDDAAGRRLGALGGALTVLAALGGVRALNRRRRVDAVMTTAIVGQFLFFASGAGRQFPEPRHLITLMPLLAVWAADGCLWIASAARRAFGRDGAPSWRAGAAVLGVAAFVPAGEPGSLGGSLAGVLVDLQTEAYRPDTRALATEWCERQVAEGSVVMNVHEALPVRMGPSRIRFVLDRARGLAPGDPRNHQRGYSREWRLRLAAAEAPGRRSFDVLILEAPWQGERSAEAERNREGFRVTWPHEPARRPADVPPVERYVRIPWENLAPSDLRPSGPWPAADDLRPGTRVEWIASTSTTYDNYADVPSKRRKREEWPAWAAFFDDLKAHYDVYEWRSGSKAVGPHVRIWDVRRRVEGRPPRTTVVTP